MVEAVDIDVSNNLSYIRATSCPKCSKPDRKKYYSARKPQIIILKPELTCSCKFWSVSWILSLCYMEFSYNTDLHGDYSYRDVFFSHTIKCTTLEIKKEFAATQRKFLSLRTVPKLLLGKYSQENRPVLSV